MILRWIKSYLRHAALDKGRHVALWRRLARPSAADWTEYVRRHGGLHRMGEHCFILPETVFTDPAYTSIGNNVMIAGAWLSGHDGSVSMASRAYGIKLDAVGPVIIHDDVFIGVGARILPGVSIGPRAIVGAGSVISKDVPPNSVVAGNPARFIRTLDEHVEKLKARTEAYPWNDLIQKRGETYDTVVEAELKKRRIAHFFGSDKT